MKRAGGLTGGPSLGEHVEDPADGIFAACGGLLGARNTVDLQTVQVLVQIADADIADGVLVLCRGLGDSTVGGQKARPGVTRPP